MGKSYSCNKF